MVLTVVVTLIFAVFFTGMETALVFANKLHMEIDKQASPYKAWIFDKITNNQPVFITTMITGYYISMVVFAVSVTVFSIKLFATSTQYPVFLFTLIILGASAIFIFLCDLAPRILFKLIPNTFLNIFLFPVTLFYILLYPFTILIISVLKILGGLFKKNQQMAVLNNVFSRGDLDELLIEKKPKGDKRGEPVKTEVQLFKNALDFSKVKLREIMIPRNEMEMMDINETSVSEVHQRFVETGYSRIIFFEQNIDNIIGYIHSSVIFKNPESIRPYLTKVLIVPETMAANRLLGSLIREHRSIAIVVDEFGGTSGMVTTEDILEEIFGEIEDEHDTVDILEKKLDEHSFLFSGRAEIDHINSVYQIDLPESDDFETLAGFILFHHESVPKINTIIRIGKFQFKILKATNTKIELVKLTLEDAK